MTITMAEESRDGYLFARLSGPVTESSIVDLGAALRARCEELGVDRVLLDAAGLEGALSVGAMFYVGPRFVEALGPGRRVAYVNPPAHWSADDDRFNRNVVNTRGGFLEVFASEAEALAWLGVGERAAP